MTSIESTLLDKLEVTPTDNNQVIISVTLPSDHIHHFITLLDSLTGFTRIIKRKERLAKLKASSYNEILDLQAKQFKQQYHSRIVRLFDQFISEGLNRTSAIKAIGAELRKDDHPWCSPDLVRYSLREAGRSGRIGRPRKQS